MARSAAGTNSARNATTGSRQGEAQIEISVRCGQIESSQRQLLFAKYGRRGGLEVNGVSYTAIQARLATRWALGQLITRICVPSKLEC